jgi:hypothetical protein
MTYQHDQIPHAWPHTYYLPPSPIYNLLPKTIYLHD